MRHLITFAILASCASGPTIDPLQARADVHLKAFIEVCLIRAPDDVSAELTDDPSQQCDRDFNQTRVKELDFDKQEGLVALLEYFDQKVSGSWQTAGPTPSPELQTAARSAMRQLLNADFLDKRFGERYDHSPQAAREGLSLLAVTEPYAGPVGFASTKAKLQAIVDESMRVENELADFKEYCLNQRMDYMILSLGVPSALACMDGYDFVDGRVPQRINTIFAMTRLLERFDFIIDNPEGVYTGTLDEDAKASARQAVRDYLTAERLRTTLSLQLLGAENDMDARSAKEGLEALELFEPYASAEVIGPLRQRFEMAFEKYNLPEEELEALRKAEFEASPRGRLKAAMQERGDAFETLGGIATVRFRLIHKGDGGALWLARALDSCPEAHGVEGTCSLAFLQRTIDASNDNGHAILYSDWMSIYALTRYNVLGSCGEPTTTLTQRTVTTFRNGFGAVKPALTRYEDTDFTVPRKFANMITDAPPSIVITDPMYRFENGKSYGERVASFLEGLPGGCSNPVLQKLEANIQDIYNNPEKFKEN